jgi:signal transduction histidine kinase
MTRRPRTLLAIAAAFVLAVLLLFTVALLRANANERKDAEQRFRDRASISASVTGSLFTSTTGQTATQLTRDFGDSVDQKALDERLQQSQGSILWATIVDRFGRVIARTGEGGPKVGDSMLEDPGIKLIRSGAPISLSNLMPGAPPRFTFGVPFPGEGDANRIYLQAFSGQLIGVFLGGLLKDLPGDAGTRAYVLDQNEIVLGTPLKDQPVGKRVPLKGFTPAVAAARNGRPDLRKFDSGGTEYVFADAPIRATNWRVILTEKTSTLYAGISTTVEWLILVALALAGLASIILLARATRAGAEAAAANIRLESANLDLERSNIELQRSNAELEQFASVASHDLQEPLRKVQTFGDQLERRFGEEIPDEGVDYLRRMRGAAQRMSVLIDDLLRFSRVTTRALPPESVDLEKIAREVTSDLDAAIQETVGTVEIGSLPTIEADPLQMRQLLQNLIGNAIKFHRPGISPVVRVEAATTRDPRMVAFSVADNGIGFEEEYSERIFRVFERLHPRDVYPGTGIGLALCRKIAERHGGSVSVDSKPDEGTTFTVTLPQKAVAFPHPTGAPSNGSTGETVGHVHV